MALVHRRILKWAGGGVVILSDGAVTVPLKGPSRARPYWAATHHWPCRKNIMSSMFMRSQTKCAPSKPVSA